jgi:hypothetical protein
MKLDEISERDAMIYCLGVAQAASVISSDNTFPADYKVQAIRCCFFPAVKLFENAPQIQPKMQAIIDLAIHRSLEALVDDKQRQVAIHFFQTAIGQQPPDQAIPF